MRELWAEIEGVKKGYMVSNYGRVRGLYGRIMKQFDKGKGRKIVHLVTQTGEQKSFLVHRLVAEAFVTKPCEGLEVNHIDGDPGNNRAENLEWITHKENMQHASKAGLFTNRKKRGQLFSESDVRRIRESSETHAALAREFGVSPEAIANIRKRKCYKWVE